MMTIVNIRYGSLIAFELEDQGVIEHSIVVQRYENAIAFEQNGNTVTIPEEDFMSFMKAAMKVWNKVS